jgi:hypothetical protein
MLPTKAVLVEVGNLGGVQFMRHVGESSVKYGELHIG